MLLLQQFIDKDLIKNELISKDKNSIIEEMAELLIKKGIVTDKRSFIDAINKREELESTAIGDGIAIPHARADCIKEIKVAFAKSSKGVDFKSSDKKPVFLIFMIASPTSVRKEYLQLVAKIARLLKSKTMKEGLLKTKTPEEVMELIRDFDGVIPEEIKVETKEGRVIH